MDVNHMNTSDIQLKQASLTDISRASKRDFGAPALSGNTTASDVLKLPTVMATGVQEFEDNVIISDNKTTSDFLQKMIDRANKQLFSSNQELSYSLHEKTGQFMIKIINTESKEIIREIPPEKTLDAVAKMWELAGILVDEKK